MSLKFKGLVALGFLSIIGYSQSKNTIVPKTYVAAKTTTPIVIDGDQSDTSFHPKAGGGSVGGVGGG